ncbi:hypothetical protein E2C01_040159 [Portunus trituberculatus]|uniref:Uncharacterized protein n=1 Tax=Portunus trituberculatus TaxID=210409 RepID=A0A5B7FMK3_PORTR|nr:hypothetical protein [Portunus trituberculatus]
MWCEKAQKFINGKMKIKGGQTYQTAKQMSEIMNESFKTVFTEENFAEPNRTLHCRGLQETIVHKEDIKRLLDNLDVRKSNGAGW